MLTEDVQQKWKIPENWQSVELSAQTNAEKWQQSYLQRHRSKVWNQKLLSDRHNLFCLN